MFNKLSLLFLSILFVPFMRGMQGSNEEELYNKPGDAFHGFPMKSMRELFKDTPEKNKKEDKDYSQYFDHPTPIQNPALNVQLVFHLLNQIRNKDHKDTLIDQFSMLLDMHTHLSNDLLSVGRKQPNGGSTEAPEEALLALTFKLDLSKKPTTLVGDIPRHIATLIRRLQHSEIYQSDSDVGINVLLIGEPGTGKSSIAQLLAQETKRDFYKASSSSLITKFQGSGANAVKSLFNHIRKQGHPAVIFIDEIDGIANENAKDNNEEARRTVYELHNQLDKNNNQIVCILATNHLDKLPQPLKSRFDIIKIEMPSYNKRLMILNHYARSFNIEDNSLLRNIAKETDGLNCRDLERLSKEAGQIALEEHLITNPGFSLSQSFQAKSRSKGKEPEGKLDVTSYSPITLSEKHYLTAVYTTQTAKLPNQHMRRLLFEDYSQQIVPLSEEMLYLAMKETEKFTAQDIEDTVQHMHSLTSEREAEEPNELDLVAGIYYKQKIKFADTATRTRLFSYFLTNFPHQVTQNICNLLADHTIDDFTGEEIKRIITIAHNLANFRNSPVIENMDICVALHQEIRKKEKPYKIIYSTNQVFHQNIGTTIPVPYISIPLNLNRCLPTQEGTEESVPLVEDFQSEAVKGAAHSKLTRKDFRTKMNPNLKMRSFLLLYFITQVGHTLTQEQIKELIYKTEGFSWYSIEQFIKDAKDQSADNEWRLQGNSFFRIAHKYNLTLSSWFNNRHQNENDSNNWDTRLTHQFIDTFFPQEDIANEAIIKELLNQNLPIQIADTSSQTRESTAIGQDNHILRNIEQIDNKKRVEEGESEHANITHELSTPTPNTPVPLANQVTISIQAPPLKQNTQSDSWCILT